LNSAGILRFSAHSRAIVRAGLILYGVSPLPEFQKLLEPVMTLKTRVTLVRDLGAGRGISYGRTFITPSPMRVATLAVGYADGYPRHLSNTGAEVLVRGNRCALLGRVTMDQIMIDVTALPGVEIGDEAVLIGRQGSNEIPAAELAQKAGTIPWEIFTGISSRVARVFS
ncbi:MAG: alanine racemase, partial [Verrucomicrobiota bacterium]|nr:alanine racemase [Verrucomicrobiota bacterium]